MFVGRAYVLGIVCFSLLSCSEVEYSSEFNVKPYFGVSKKYVCDINNPPKIGEAPCDIDSFRLCAHSEKLNVIICDEFSIEEGKSGAQLRLPEADDFRIFFQGFNKSKPDVMLWCGATEKIALKKGDKKDVSVFIGRCSDFVFTRNKMNTSRVFHTATLLKDGRVLIVGGVSTVSLDSCDAECDGIGCKPYCRLANAIPDAEIYDYKKGEFQKIGKLNIPRALHSATLLEDGRVVIVGGSRRVKLYLVPPPDKPFVMPEDIDDASLSIEIFDPQSNTFKKVQGEVSRAMHSAYLAHNGKIYIFGGIGNSSGEFESNIAEVDPRFGMKNSEISLTVGRVMPNIIDFSIVDPTSNTIVVAGGSIIDESKNKGNSFDIVSFSDVTPSIREHKYSSKDSYILSSLGSSMMPVNSGKFILCGGMLMRDHKLSFDGRDIFVFSQNPLDLAYYFDINNNSVSYPERNRNLMYKRSFSQSVYLYSKNPRILFVGGFESVNSEYLTDSSFIPFIPSRSVELFIVNSDLFDSIHPYGIVDAASPVIKMNEGRAGHTLTVLPDQSVLIIGGFSSGREISNTAEIFEPYPVDKNESLLVY
ncbi:MAG: hypothetical protein N2746_01450 [Deltaproteobacteria bacterium]|nr:hypothetical protein [Deltaproteobacteria bacterium]